MVPNSLTCAPGFPDFFPMRDARQQPRSWLRVILSDVHFWVPVVVLLGGLLVLRWIS